MPRHELGSFALKPLGIHAIILFPRARGLVNLWHRIGTGRYVKTDKAGPGNLDSGG